MDWRPLPIFGGSYADDALPWSAQDTVNWLPVPAERAGTRSPVKFASVPGLVEFADLGTDLPVRGTHDVEGLLLAVSGNKLFRVSTTGAPTEIGTIPGVSRVSMAHNQAAIGHEVMIANGQSGYVYNTYTGDFGQVSDDGFPGLKVADFVDGYIAGVEPQGRFWLHSELRNAGSYNTLDRYDAESAPDKIVTLVVSHREVMVLNQRSAAFFRNTGQATGTFQNANGMEMDVGCASAFAVAAFDNTVYWLGNDGAVYRLNGHQPQRISTGPIEQDIARRNMANAFAMTFEDRGHKLFILTLTDGFTWCFDAWTGEWTRRQSYGLNRWRLNTLTKSAGRWIGGDYSNGKLYRLDWDVMDEAGDPIVARRRTPVMHAEGHDISIAGLKLVFDVGRAPVGESDHFASIRYSDDGGHNWSAARLADIGAAGKFRQEVVERRLGQAEQRIWEIEVSSPAKRDLVAASVMAERSSK